MKVRLPRDEEGKREEARFDERVLLAVVILEIGSGGSSLTTDCCRTDVRLPEVVGALAGDLAVLRLDLLCS